MVRDMRWARVEAQPAMIKGGGINFQACWGLQDRMLGFAAGFMGQPVMLPNGAVVDSQRLPGGAVLDAPVHVNEGAMLESIRSAPGSARRRPARFSGGRLRHSSSSHSQHSSHDVPAQGQRLRRLSAASSDVASLQGRIASVSDSLGSMMGARAIETDSPSQISTQNSSIWEPRLSAGGAAGHSPGRTQPLSSGSEPTSVHYHPIQLPSDAVIETGELLPKLVDILCSVHILI